MNKDRIVQRCALMFVVMRSKGLKLESKSRKKQTYISMKWQEQSIFRQKATGAGCRRKGEGIK